MAPQNSPPSPTLIENPKPIVASIIQTAGKIDDVKARIESLAEQMATEGYHYAGFIYVNIGDGLLIFKK